MSGKNIAKLIKPAGQALSTTAKAAAASFQKPTGGGGGGNTIKTKKNFAASALFSSLSFNVYYYVWMTFAYLIYAFVSHISSINYSQIGL